MNKRSFIIDAKRSVIGKFLGGLSPLSAVDIGTRVVAAILRDHDLKPDTIEEVFIGQVVQAGMGQNPARQVALNAGVSNNVTAVTVNQVCGSGLRAVMTADRAIRSGDVNVVLAGGMESMTNCPHLLRGLRDGSTKMGDTTLIDSMVHDGLRCAFDACLMGETAEYVAEKQRISRAEQDEWSVRSHQRAAKAIADGAFRREIVPIEIVSRKKTVTVDTDECVRADSSMEALGKLPTVFRKDGSVTAGNASALADGAAMVLVASETAVSEHGWKPRAKILSASVAGGPPRELFTATIPAIRAALDKARLKTSDIDLYEINEAFAVQSVACVRGLEIDAERVNVDGGSIALGHPIGASGARILTTLLHGLERRNLRRGVAGLCLGGGNAVAMVIERV
ncbi:MAG: thiolase family protein [Phycisphaerae bacterium]|nr:thiolase family protein [Phycisphaerae bacterium]NUQ46358.1 thiolase family protein [Phycisphaerae bacterium]